MNATSVTTAARSAATRAAKKTPALPLTGNPAIDARISASQAVLPEIHAIDDPEGDRLTRLLVRLRRANLGILRGQAESFAQAEARLQAFLMAEALPAVADTKWRVLTVEQSLRALEEHDPQDAAPLAFQRFRADVSALYGATPPASPGVREAADAYLQAYAAHDAAVAAYGLIEARERAGEIDKDHPDCAAADAAVVAASDAADAAWRAFMATPSMTVADVMLKQDQASKCEAVRYDPEEARHTFDHINADMRRLFGGSAPTEPTEPPAPRDPDADLIALGAKFEAAWAEQRAYDIERGDAGYSALQDTTSAIGRCIQAIRPTTLEGFRIKARVAQECQTDTLTECFELTTQSYSDEAVAQTIVNDLLGLENRPEVERAADEAAVHEALAEFRRRGMAAPGDKHTPAAEAWYAARARYHAAQAASDAYHAPGADEADPEGSDRALDEVSTAMERWEILPPPSWDALVEVMLASLDFNALDPVYGTTNDPAAWRDLLDSGDTHEIFAARFTLHALRLTGQAHPALEVAPVSCLYPSHDHTEYSSREEWLQAAAKGRPYPGARPELVEWWRVILSDPKLAGQITQISGPNVQAWWDAGLLVTDIGRETLALVQQYEAAGGRMTLCIQDGRPAGLHTLYPRDDRRRGEELRTALHAEDRRDALRRVLECTGRVYYAEEAVPFDEDVIAARLPSNMAAE